MAEVHAEAVAGAGKSLAPPVSVQPLVLSSVPFGASS